MDIIEIKKQLRQEIKFWNLRKKKTKLSDKGYAYAKGKLEASANALKLINRLKDEAKDSEDAAHFAYGDYVI